MKRNEKILLSSFGATGVVALILLYYTGWPIISFIAWIIMGMGLYEQSIDQISKETIINSANDESDKHNERKQKPENSIPINEIYKQEARNYIDCTGRSARGINQQVHIQYMDGSGDVTERDIIIRSLHGNSMGYEIDAECLLRNQPRTFESCRIQKLTDKTTGEVVVDNVTAWLRDNIAAKHLWNKPHKSPL